MMNFKTLTFWAICLAYGSVLIAQPEPCGPNPAMTSFCADACVICDIDGFSGINDLTAQGQPLPGFCTTQYNNMQYIAFIAGSVDLTIEVQVGTCVGGGGWSSLELGFYQSDDCENFTAITNCDTDIPSNTTETFTNIVPLTIGQHYYMVIDGSNSSNCTWTFNVLEGTTEVLALASSGTVSGPVETCPDFATTFATTPVFGAATYFWSIDDVVQSVQGEEVDLTFTADGSYEVCVTASNVCDQGPASCTMINVRTPGTLAIDEILCFGECVEANGIQFCETGIYQEIIVLPNGCDSIINIDIEVLPQPQSTIDLWICNGTEYFIGTTPYGTTGMYTNTVLTSNECDSLVFLDLLVIECEIMGSTDHVPAICKGSATGILQFSLNQGTPPLTYTYTNIMDVSITGTGTTNLLVDNEIPGIPAGEYQIYIQDEFGNDVVLLQEVTEPPVLEISLLASDYGGFNVSCFSTNGLPGDDGTLFADVSGGVPPYTFLWSDNQATQDAVGLLAELYSVTVTDAVGCTIEASYTLLPPPSILADVAFRDPTCDGLETGEIEVLSIQGGTPSYLYSLTGATFQGDSIYNELSEGIYQLYVQDANGCVEIYESEITAPDIPVIVFPENLTIYLGDQTIINPILNNIKIAELIWTPTETLSCPDCLNPTASPVNDATYEFTVISEDGCVDIETISISVIKRRRVYVANVFSPNFDGVNDKLIVNAGPEAALVTKFSVFDRWGSLVYEATDFLPNDTSTGWDGRYKGKTHNPGTFVWVAEVLFIDGVSLTYSGSVGLLR